MATEEVAREVATYNTIVCHCMWSQQRGPLAARTLAAHITTWPEPRPRVRVLQDGFMGFQRLFRDNPQGLIEDYDAELYEGTDGLVG